MTTKVTILNHGPVPIRISGGTSTPADLAPHAHEEFYLYDGAPLTIEEVVEVTPNLAGGSGEEHP